MPPPRLALTLTCVRCRCSWHPRTPTPGQCAKCKSPFWDEPRVGAGNKRKSPFDGLRRPAASVLA